MGEVLAEVDLENAGDRFAFEEGLKDEADVRRYRLEAIVDTGAVMLMLPQNVVEKLGLRQHSTVIVTYADERSEERSVAGPLMIKIGDRSMNLDCIVGPPLSEALIGQVVLETLDLLPDCRNRTLIPRPGSPDYPHLKMK